MPEPGRIPAEDGSVLAAVQAPAELAWERQPCPALGRSGRPAKRSRRAVEFCVNVRPEVEGEADIMATALELIGDLDGLARLGPSERTGGARPMAAAPRTRRVQRSSSRWSRRPYREFPPLRVSQPQERSASGRLPLPVDLDRVVPDRRLEVLSPLRLTVVAVRARVGEDVHAAVADLHRQRVGVRVRGDGQEAVRARRRSGTIARESRRRPFGGS